MIVGIDPGIKGALAAFSEDFAGVWAGDEPMPVIQGVLDSKIVDVKKLKQLLIKLEAEFVYIERPIFKFGVSSKSTFTVLENFGRILAVLEEMELAHRLIMPSSWQSIIAKETGIKKDKDTPAKDMARVWHDNIFGRFRMEEEGPTTRKIKDGVIDAYLIAYAGFILQRDDL